MRMLSLIISCVSHRCFFFPAALLVMTLGSYVPARWSVYIGSLVAMIAYVVGAFVTDIRAAYFFLGAMTGLYQFDLSLTCYTGSRLTSI